VSSHVSGSSCNYTAYGEDSAEALMLTVRFGELDAKYHAKRLRKAMKTFKALSFLFQLL
jgi:hypothetical protein